MFIPIPFGYCGASRLILHNGKKNNPNKSAEPMIISKLGDFI